MGQGGAALAVAHGELNLQMPVSTGGGGVGGRVGEEMCHLVETRLEGLILRGGGLRKQVRHCKVQHVHACSGWCLHHHHNHRHHHHHHHHHHLQVELDAVLAGGKASVELAVTEGLGLRGRKNVK